MTQELMTTNQVARVVELKGTAVSTVTFLKVSGEERVITGNFVSPENTKGGPKGAEAAAKNAANNLVPIYSLSDEGWRSFKSDRVVTIT